jgi:molybdopterin converting factor subunit 1
LKILIKFFASHREFVGSADIEIELSDNATVSELHQMLLEHYPDLKKLEDETIISVNKNYAEGDHVLQAGDEVALFPPISGG